MHLGGQIKVGGASDTQCTMGSTHLGPPSSTAARLLIRNRGPDYTIRSKSHRAATLHSASLRHRSAVGCSGIVGADLRSMLVQQTA